MMGWIKLHRQFMEWEWYTDNHVKSVFIHCLLMANIEKKEWRGVSIDRGSFVTSIGKLAIDTGLTVKAVRIALDKLKKTSEIVTEGANQWTMITVCKYDIYQQQTPFEGQTNGKPQGEQRANEGQTKGKRRATTKEYKERKECKEGEEGIISGEKKSPVIYSDFISIYDLFVKKVNNAPAKIDSVQGSFAKKIIAYLSRATKDRNHEAGDAEILSAWQFILDQYDNWGAFYQEKIRLQDIYTNLENIIRAVKNGRQQRGQKELADKFAEVDRIAELVYGNQPVR